jgi:predicted solute-binding protein
MFYGFHAGPAVVEGCTVEHVLEDIQSLDRRALAHVDLESTAVSPTPTPSSPAATPCSPVAPRWAVGPVVVARAPRTLASLAGQRVAVPEPLTIAALLLRCEYPGCVPAVSRGFRASIGAAHAHEHEAIRHAMQFGRGLDTGMGKRFVHMYVDDLTLDMGETGQRALARLYERAQDGGAIERAPQLEVY